MGGNTNPPTGGGGKTTTREEVFQAVTSELDYQAKLGVLQNASPVEQIALIRQMLYEVESAWYSFSQQTGQTGQFTQSQHFNHVLDLFRQIAGISTLCMEQWGAPVRKTRAA